MAAKSASWLYEARPMKKPRLGPADVYPQEVKQREDDLSALHVKQGFMHGSPSVQDEYGSARNSNITSNKFGAWFSALLAKKQELNTFVDIPRRKPTTSKESLWLVTPRTKAACDGWFRDLAAGSKTLIQLSKRIPILHKREEILTQLYDAQVPMYRAAFYIKSSYQYMSAMNEAGQKSKKRTVPDPAVEWTSTICKQLREIYVKLHEYNLNTSVPASITASPISIETTQHQWSYFTQLARHLIEENLLDRHDFLTWLLELFEKVKNIDDPILRLLCLQILNYIEDITDFELLSRKLAHQACRKVNQLLGDCQPSTDLSDSADDVKNPTESEVLKCPNHRGLLIMLSAIIQIITLRCKTALIWHPQANEGKMPNSLTGSPLDHLPCPPSALPMSKLADKPETRAEIRQAEEEIRIRSCFVENKWSTDKLQQSTTGILMARSLQTLEALDRHFFDKVDPNNSLESLYSKIFKGSNGQLDDDDSCLERSIETILKQDEETVKLLCEWAVTTKRSGEYRSLYVAKLLERRQCEITSQNESSGPETPSSSNGESSSKCQASSESVPIFQSILMNFLDNQAPFLDEKSPKPENKMAFSNLVLLFGELIRCDVFSHDVYMCTMISRGYFTSPSNVLSSGTDVKVNPSSSLGAFGQTGSNSGGNQSSSHSAEGLSLPMFDPLGHSHPKTETLSWDTPQMDMDDDGVDADLDKLLQHITAKGQQSNQQDQTDILLPDSSPEKDDDGNAIGHGDKSLAARHLLYTTHFPLSQDETMVHECNQRLVLLYGVGKTRDEARHAAKKVTKDILKLFSRKASMDISDMGKVKKSATKDGFNFEQALTRFQALPYYDQSVVTSSCATACIEMLNGVASGKSNYLPLVESIAFLFDLFEMALNIHGMIEFIIQLLKELDDIEKQIITQCPSLKCNYTPSIGLYIIGLLFRFQACLVVSMDEVFQVFEGCSKLVKHVQNPADCSSPERCILGYLFDLYYSVHPLKTKNHDSVSSIIPLLSKVKGVIYGPLQPSAVNLLWNSGYLMDCLTNPKNKVEPNMVKQLNENPNCRYSFVCNAVKQIAHARDANLINELSILCAELSARCPPLSAEWIGVLKALCCSSNRACGFIDSLGHREVADLGIHDNLAIFTSILVARRCFSLQDFVIHCALPSLLAACPQGGGDSEAEPGARLTCHLLLRLFRTSDPPSELSLQPVVTTPATTLYSLTSPGPNNLFTTPRPTYIIKHPCDRYLLAAAHTCIRVEAVIAALKAILVLGDANEGSGSNKQEVSVKDLLSHIDDEDDFGMPFVGKRENMEAAGLGVYAKMALREICSQEWVHDKCLRDPDMLCKPDLLLDTMLTPKQARQLLEMICRPKATVATFSDSEFDQKAYISQILQSLDEWTLRISRLQLNLMYAQCSPPSSNDVSVWLENVARTTIDFFQNAIEDTSRPPSKSGSHQKGSSKSSHSQKPIEPQEVRESRVWLVSPLISKLPVALQGKILRVAANVLESGNWMNPPSSQSSYSGSSSKNKERFSMPKSNANSAANALLSYPPFLSLVLMCLKGQDDQRESLLKSLFSQLEQAVEQKISDDLKVRLAIQEGLQLRLSLVGGMLDMIQKSNTVLTEWSLLLRNLIENGVVDPQLNYELFSIVIDILAVLVHTTHVSDSSADSKDEPKKHYYTLMKRLRKDFSGERATLGMNMLKQLIPMPRNTIDVVVCEPMGSLIDTKGNKIAGFDSIDKKQGLQVAEKQKVPAWELIEGSKNPAPLLWSWFGAVGCERKPLKSEEMINSLQWHSHSMRKPTAYFLESPPLPPEDEPEPTPPPQPAILPSSHAPQPHVNEPKPLMAQQMPSMNTIPQQMHHHPSPQMMMQQQQPMQQSQMQMPNYQMHQPMSSIHDEIPDVVQRAKPGPKPKQQRKKRTPKNQQQQSGQQTPPVRPPSAYEANYGIPPVAPNVQQQQQQQPMQQNNPSWYGQMNQPVAQSNIGQQGYYQQGPPQNNPAIGGPMKGKAAISSMLRARGQQQQFMQTSNPVGPQAPTQQPQMFVQRPGMRPSRPMQMQPQMPAMNQSMMMNQQAPQPQMQQQMHMQTQGNYGHQQNMNYGGQGPPMPDQPPQQQMMNQGYHQQMMRSQHIQQPPQQMQQQFMPPRQEFNQRGQYNPNVTMGVQGPYVRPNQMLQRQLSGPPMNSYQQQQQPGQYQQ